MRDKITNKTVSVDHNFWRERRAEADSNRGPCHTHTHTSCVEGWKTGLVVRDLACVSITLQLQEDSKRSQPTAAARWQPKNTSLVATKVLAWSDKSFVAKTCLSWQKYACRDKTLLVMTKVWHDCSLRVGFFFFCDKTFVTTSILLSRQKTCLPRQKWYLWQPPPMIH